MDVTIRTLENGWVVEANRNYPVMVGERNYPVFCSTKEEVAAAIIKTVKTADEIEASNAESRRAYEEQQKNNVMQMRLVGGSQLDGIRPSN